MITKKPSKLFLQVMGDAYPEIDGMQYYVELYGHCQNCQGTGEMPDNFCEECDGLGVMLDMGNVGVCYCGCHTVNISHDHHTCTKCDDSRQVRKPRRKNYPDRYARTLL